MQNSENPYLLKVLNGVHGGASIPLSPGSYIMGSDQEADLIFDAQDIGVRHLRLDLTRPTAELTQLCPSQQVRAHRPLEHDVPLAVAFFQQIEAGSLVFALGPADGPWPQTLMPLYEEAKTGELTPQPSSRRRSNFVPLAIFGMCAPLSGWLLNNSPPAHATPIRLAQPLSAFQAQIELFATQHKVQISNMEQTPNAWVIRGYVPDVGAAKRFEKRLAEHHIPVNLMLIDRSNLEHNLKTTLKLYGHSIDAQITPDGNAILRGVIHNGHAWNTLKATIRQDLPALADIQDRTLPAQKLAVYAASQCRQKLPQAEVSFELQGHSLVANIAAMPASAIVGWVAFKKELENDFFVEITENKILKKRLPSKEVDQTNNIKFDRNNIKSIIIGESKYIVLKNGTYCFEGSKLQDDLFIKTISKNALTVTNGRQVKEITLGDI